MKWRKGETRYYSVGGGRGDGENGDNGNGKRTKKEPEKKHQGEHKREDTKRRGAAKKITKTAKLRVLYWNVAALRKTEE
jgi:hypothetical protein